MGGDRTRPEDGWTRRLVRSLVEKSGGLGHVCVGAAVCHTARGCHVLRTAIHGYIVCGSPITTLCFQPCRSLSEMNCSCPSIAPFDIDGSGVSAVILH